MSTYSVPDVNGRPPQIVDAGIYSDIRFDPSDATPTYIGLNLTNPASTSSTDWKIYKLSYSGSDVTRIQLAYGSWDNRTSLF